MSVRQIITYRAICGRQNDRILIFEEVSAHRSTHAAITIKQKK
jgi:hypothetical protein